MTPARTGGPTDAQATGRVAGRADLAARHERAAALLAANRLRPGPFPGLPEACRPAGEAEAYDLQAVLHRHLAAAGLGAVAGAKIGCTTPVMQRFLGIGSPCAGGVLAPAVQAGAGRFRHADFRHVGVECELAVRLGRDLGPDGAPHDRDSAGRAVAAVMAAIEVVDDRYRDFRALDVATLIADDFFNAACVLGTPASRWPDLADLSGRMAINGAEVGSGRGRDILGHPFEGLAWLANLRASRGERLAAGSFVLLGSLVETKWVAPGDAVLCTVDGLGTVAATFDG